MLGIFLDSETNGLNSQKHRIVEVAFKIVDILDGRVLDTFESLISVTPEEWKKSDPDSLHVNGFTWEEVLKGVSPAVVGEKIRETFAKNRIKRGEAVFICQNPSFDRVFFSQLIDADIQEKLLWPYHWLDLASMYWVESMKRGASGTGNYPWETGFSKDKIAIAHSLPREEQPHRAMNGVKHLLLCYEAVVGFPKS
ncbi:MAG: 3'-5' exonuclease [Verrucomicrobia bacterium]|nr:3'-5' exonuclease [Verrucomicrobiota bacterium]